MLVVVSFFFKKKRKFSPLEKSSQFLGSLANYQKLTETDKTQSRNKTVPVKIEEVSDVK
jgi:hypothetical protein